MTSLSFNSDFIISTDLDGTLLDHHTYEWQAMSSALALIKEKNILLVFNTSKTLLEAKNLQSALAIDAPMIIENGSALAIPESLLGDLALSKTEPGCRFSEGCLVKNFGKTREQILSYLASQRAEYPGAFESYNDWSLETIMAKTGLDKSVAQMSSAKEYSEPFIWLGEEESLCSFIARAQANEFQVLQGGRFFHLLGNTNKSVPIVWLKSQIENQSAESTTLICLGDNKNDIHMLDVADIPVCVKSPTSPFPEIKPNPNTIYTEEYGPAGWNTAMLSILHDKKTNKQKI